MRSAAVAFAAAWVLCLIGLVGIALAVPTSLVYTLGVNPARLAARLDPGDRACQRPVRVPHGAAFDRVGIVLGTYSRLGPEVRVDVVHDRSGRRLATGSLPAGYRDLELGDEHLVTVGRVQTDAPLRVCVVNAGDRRVAAIGQVGVASPATEGTLNGKPITNDVAVNLHADETSLLARMPDIARRAATFRAGWVTPIVYLFLAFGIMVVAPVILARAITGAAAADRAELTTR
jgi:hypothetical protein